MKAVQIGIRASPNYLQCLQNRQRVVGDRDDERLDVAPFLISLEIGIDMLDVTILAEHSAFLLVSLFCNTQLVNT